MDIHRASRKVNRCRTQWMDIPALSDHCQGTSTAGTDGMPMNFQLVPYQPPRCRRPAEVDASNGTFEGFLRGGGSLRGVQLGSRIQVAPDEEEAPLLREARQTNAAIMNAANRQSRVTMCAIIVALGIAVAVFIGLGVVVYRVNDNMQQMELLFRPHAQEITNATVDMMHDLGGSFTNIKDITRKTNEIANMPTEPIAQSLNNTADITARLREFLRHPTIQLSLGNTDANGVAGRL
jgi:hypothetical protein